MGHCGGMGSIPGPAQGMKGSSVAAAVTEATAAAQIQSLMQELPCTLGVAIKKKKKKEKVDSGDKVLGCHNS